MSSAAYVAPGMPEAGYLPIPTKLARRVVKDMVRISESHMSGTAFGTIVLHIASEAAIGDPLAVVQNSDQGCDFDFLCAKDTPQLQRRIYR